MIDLSCCVSLRCAGIVGYSRVGVWHEFIVGDFIDSVMKKFFTFLLVVVMVLLCFHLSSLDELFDRDKNPEFDRDKSPEQVELDWVDESADSVAMAQSTHLKFKGVPIDGSLELFVNRMQRNGFVLTSSLEDDVVRLEGDFAGFKQCEVYVATLDHKDLVARITVFFPSQEQWKNLYGDYKNLKGMLIEKYGKPASCVERFTGSLGYLGEDLRMTAVCNDECQYVTRFASDEGDIILSIEYRGSSTCYVQLVYKDKKNGQAVRNAAIEDL